MAGIRDLKGKVVVITGAGSGIGRATALMFAAEGADLVIADRFEDRLGPVADEIRRLGARALTSTVDVSDREQVEAFARFVMAERGRVDILYSNAGVAIGGSFENTSVEDFEWIFSINFWGGLFCLKAFLPHMVQRRSGHIVITASIAGLCSAPGMSAYCSTKFAMAGLGEALRAELKQHGIGVTTICPGIINTGIIADGRMYTAESSRAGRENLLSFYKKGWPPERVAKAVLKAVKKNSSVVPVGPEAWVQWFFKRITQKGFDAMAEISGRLLMKP